MTTLETLNTINAMNNSIADVKDMTALLYGHIGNAYRMAYDTLEEFDEGIFTPAETDSNISDAEFDVLNDKHNALVENIDKLYNLMVSLRELKNNLNDVMEDIGDIAYQTEVLDR